MDLDQQIQVLIQNAPQDGVTPRAVAMIAPVLKTVAQQLQHPQYYILQTFDQSWVLTTLSHRTQPNLEKNVIYAFPTLKDVTADSKALRDPQVLALPIPITHILFQMVALETIDSVIFFETSGELNSGTEVRRAEVQALIEAHLQQSSSHPLPPNIA